MPKSKNMGMYDFASSSDESDDSEEEYVPDYGTDEEEITGSMDEDDQCRISRPLICSLPTSDSEALCQSIPVASVQVTQMKNTKTTRSYD